MSDYDKTSYQGKKAEFYDEERFASPQGQTLDKIERASFENLLSNFVEPILVLDLASGTGRFSELLVLRGHAIVCADVSRDMLELSKKRLKSTTQQSESLVIGHVLCDALYLPFRENVFGCVSAMRFMHLLPNEFRRKVFDEASRVTNMWLIFDLSNARSVIVLNHLWEAMMKKKRKYFSCTIPTLKRELGASRFLIHSMIQPLMIPPGKIPTPMLSLVRLLNRLLSNRLTGRFSEKVFVLARKLNQGNHVQDRHQIVNILRATSSGSPP